MLERRPVPSVATVATNLLTIATASEPPHPNGGPAELGHQLRQTTARGCAPVALRNFQDIEHGLRGNALDAIVADLSAQSLQGQPPGISIPCGKFGLKLSQFA